MNEEGRHFSCERGCTRDDYGKAGPFFSRATENGPDFVAVSWVQTSVTQRQCRPSCVNSRVGVDQLQSLWIIPTAAVS